MVITDHPPCPHVMGHFPHLPPVPAPLGLGMPLPPHPFSPAGNSMTHGRRTQLPQLAHARERAGLVPAELEEL
jgi:hypothetical protein